MKKTQGFSIDDANTMLSFQKQCGVDAWFLDEKTLEKFHTLRFEKPQEKTVSKDFQTLDDFKKFIASIHSPLKTSAQNCLIGTGPEKPSIMIINDAPNAEEDRLGKFLEGETGLLLQKIFESLGYSADQLYMTSISPYKMPPHYTGETEEIERFATFIHTHINLIKPQKLVLLGSKVLKAVMKTQEKIMYLRGKDLIYETLGGEKIKTIATFHPQYVLKAPLQKKVIWQDLLTLQMKAEKC